jgi:hypothetical protein
MDRMTGQSTCRFNRLAHVLGEVTIGRSTEHAFDSNFIPIVQRSPSARNARLCGIAGQRRLYSRSQKRWLEAAVVQSGSNGRASPLASLRTATQRGRTCRESPSPQLGRPVVSQQPNSPLTTALCAMAWRSLAPRFQGPSRNDRPRDRTARISGWWGPGGISRPEALVANELPRIRRFVSRELKYDRIYRNLDVVIRAEGRALAEAIPRFGDAGLG